MASRRKQMGMYELDGIRIMNLGEMDIWDGADLALLRDTLSHWIQHDRLREVGIDMSTVKCIPSGFFGMLFDWHDQGIGILFVDPLPNIRRMLWFRQFAAPLAEGLFELTNEHQEEFTARGVGHWEDDLPEPMLCESAGRRASEC